MNEVEFVVRDALNGSINLKGEVLEETNTFITIKQGYDVRVIYKHNIISPKRFQCNKL